MASTLVLALAFRDAVPLPAGPVTAPSDPYGPERAFARCPGCRRAYPVDVATCALDGRALVLTSGRTLIGRTVANRYAVELLLGSGGMGEVYKARHLALGRALALKVMLPSITNRSAAIALLHREAQNASRVEHTNAVRVYDLESQDGLLFLTMDYVPGPTVLDVVDRRGALHPRLVVDIVRHVALGLEAIHAAGIVHRDLKPSNVVLTRTRDGLGTPTAKLLDFGISRAFGEPEQSLTQSGHVVGTPVFMSPEQRAGIPLDKRSDVFALAVMAAFLLAGTLPHISPATCLRLADVPQSHDWPEGIRHALLHGLMWERNQRADSALRFANRLADAVPSFVMDSDAPESIDAELRAGRWAHAELGRVPTPTLGTVAPVAAQPDRTDVAQPLRQADPRTEPALQRVDGPRIEGISGPLVDHSYRVGGEPVLIGRDPTVCTVVFPGEATVVSRIHASILWNAAARRFVLRDEGSRNATIVGESQQLEPDRPVELPPGGTFAVGRADYRFRVRCD